MLSTMPVCRRIAVTALATLFISPAALAQLDLPEVTTTTTGVEILRGQAARDRANALGLQWRGETPDGRKWSIERFEGGVPQYISTNNVTAAKTISTDKVWNGTSLSLTGAGATIGMWDGGTALQLHEQYINRVFPIDAIAVDSHATHVCGTMISAGIPFSGNGSASRGSAPAAIVHSYDWDSDEWEMSSAAQNGLRLSNHSYGTVLGWAWGDWSGNEGWHWFGDPSVNPFEDYRFGYYSSHTRDWDVVAYNNPRYTIVKSAGNDRNDNGPGGPLYGHYVKINGTWQYSIGIFRNPDGDGESIGGPSCAKNILVVGAVEDLPGGYPGPSGVDPTSFTGFGPTDDLRVKPDVVANGATLLSTDSGSFSDYSVKSGTSMSAPSVTGALALLLEHYRDVNPGSDPLSSTMRGLVIHTADPVFVNAGPTASMGWGLMNTERAAEVISTDGNLPYTITENDLQNGEVHEFFLSGQAGERITVTAAWTDFPGNVPAPAVDPEDKALINDLDVVVTRVPDPLDHLAWQLFGPVAFQVGNDRDNVEKIEFTGEDSFYRVTVSHKGSLANGHQQYSLIVSGVSGVGPWEDCNNNNVPDQVEFIFFNDCNSNGVIDVCDDTAGGDYDADGVVSTSDALEFLSRLRGPGITPTIIPFQCAPLIFDTFDFDGDADFDVADLAEVQVNVESQ